jgi:mRNA interferase RelE/StbE
MRQIKIHRLVLEEDFKKIPPFDQKQILRAIQKKISVTPEAYGKPLHGEFSGYWRLRAGDYRVVYKIVKDEVLVYVIKVGIRRDDQVYRELLSRLKQKL